MLLPRRKLTNIFRLSAVIPYFSSCSDIAAYCPSFTRKSSVRRSMPTAVLLRMLSQFLDSLQHSVGMTGSRLARCSKG
jgi:hypothetical protein